MMHGMGGVRYGHNMTKNSFSKQQSGEKLVNGVWLDHHSFSEVFIVALVQ